MPVWPAQLKMFPVWSSAEQVCQACPSAALALLPSAVDSPPPTLLVLISGVMGERCCHGSGNSFNSSNA